MKKRWIPLLLALVLLCGCTAVPQEQPDPDPRPQLPEPTEQDASDSTQVTPELTLPLTLEENEAVWVLDYDGQQLLLAQGTATGYQEGTLYRTDRLLRWDLAGGLEQWEIGSDAYVTSGLCSGEDLLYMDYYWRGNDKFWSLLRIRDGEETQVAGDDMEWTDRLPQLFRLNGQAMYLCQSQNGPQVYRVEEDGVSLVLEVPGYTDFGADVCSNGSCYAFTVQDGTEGSTRLLVCDQAGLRYQVALPMECLSIAVNGEYAVAAMTDRQSGIYACQTLRLSDGATGLFDSSVPLQTLAGSGGSCLCLDASGSGYLLYPAMGDLQSIPLTDGFDRLYSDGRGGYLLRLDRDGACCFRQLIP